MGVGPVIGGSGLLLLMAVDRDANYLTQILPALLLFGLGLAMTVAPLTATVLGDADQNHAGIASGVNNAVARVAGLLAIAALGAVLASQFTASLDSRVSGQRLSPAARTALADARKRPLATDVPSSVRGPERRKLENALEDSSVSAFRLGIGIAGGIVILGGLVSVAGIRNPRRKVAAADCPGGAICGASEEVANDLPHLRIPQRAGEPARA
jgi:hypothetical protein